ncbi:response regulator transcription factor [Rhizobium sp. RCC_161_2]|uniref:response regulator transcription factor n=1 Tax=Rhizobium sp. RCC_161_2 TaxID=3239219 RepID=UPI0035253F01
MSDLIHFSPRRHSPNHLDAGVASGNRGRDKVGVLTFHRCINYGSYWQARCQPNADEALVLLKNNKIDTLYTDINMPGSMNGLGLANRVLSLWPERKATVVSGLIRTTGAHLAKGVSFVAKPMPPDRLLRLLSSLRAFHVLTEA